MRTQASFSVASAILLLIYITDDVHGAGFAGSPPARPKPCLLTANGEINQTSYQALKASNNLDDGVNNALTCSKLSPSQYCSSLRDGWLCILQKTNAGQCFAPPGTTPSQTAAATAPPPLSRIQFEDQLLNASLATKCPPELVEKRATQFGQVLCSALLRMANSNPVAAKTYLNGLNVFWGVMPCVVQLTRMATLALTAAEKATIANAPGLPTQVANDLKQLASPPATAAGSTGFAQLGMSSDDIVQAVSKAGSRASAAAIVKSYVAAAITKEKQSDQSKLGDDQAGQDAKTAQSRRPTPGTYAAVDTLRPMNNATADAVGIAMTDSSVFGCFGDKEISSIPRNISCRPVDATGTDPYANLTGIHRRTMRENCKSFLGANLPSTLKSVATPTEIRSECNGTTYAQLDSYIEAFSNNVDSLTADQVSSLQSCCDALHKPNNYTTLIAAGRISKLRSCICHVPVAIVSFLLKTQADIDNYCQAMAVSTSYCAQAPDILRFCLQSSTLDVGDLGNLVRALSAADVNALAATSVVQNIAKLSRVVINKLARQALLAVYVQNKNGLTALTDADFQALGSLVTEFSATDFATIQSNPAVKAYFNQAATSIQQELSDRAQRASSGTIPPAAAADISMAAANVAAVQTSDTTSSARRRKRGATPPPLIGCTGLQNLGPSVAAADLSNLNVSVFTACPSLLNADNLSFPQLQMIASQAVMALGDPLNGAACRSPTSWTGSTIQQLGVVVLAINATAAKAGSPTQMSCLNFAWMNSSLTVSSYTAKFGMPPPPLPQLQAVFNTWSTQTAFRGPLTASTAVLLGYINCGAPDSVLQAMTLTEVDKAIKMFGGLSCFTMSALQILANDTMALYATSGTPPSLNISTISNVGTIIAGMSPNFFQTLNTDQIGAITPKAISILPPQIIASLTLTQINALTAPQCVALSDNQLAVLSLAARNSVMQKINSTSPSGGPAPAPATLAPGATAPPMGTAPPMVPGGTLPPQPPPQGSDLPPKIGDATMGPPGGAGPLPPFGGNGSMPGGMNGSFPGGMPGGLPGDFNGTFPGGFPGGPPGSNGTFPGGVPPFGGGNSTGQGGLPGGVPGGIPGFPGVTGMPNTGGGTSINLQEVVNSYNPPAALPPMTVDNAYMYADKIAGAAPADIAQKLPVAALASPAVLKELSAVAESMTPTQLQTIQTQMMKVMPATAMGQNFNPSLLADAASFLGDQLVKSLSPDQALKVCQQPSFNAKDPDAVAMFGQQAAAALSSITDRSTLVNTLEKSSKVMPGIPPTNFQTIIDGTKCDDSFLTAFKNATLNPQQALLLFSKYQSDSPTDLTKMASGSVVSFVTNLPPALIQAITADSLTSVSSAPTSVLPLMSAISSSRQNSSAFDPTAQDGGPTPALNRLYEKLDKTSLSTSDLKTLANAGALRIDAIKASGDQLCSVATSATPVPLEPEEAKALYAKCSAGIGAIFTGTSDKYGRLSVAAPPADINSATDDASFMANIHNFCEGSIWFGDRQQLRVIVSKVQAHIDAKNDLSSILANISCILPYLGSKYLSTITDPSKQLLACRMMACANCEQAESSLIRDDIDFCISSGVTLGNLSCLQSDKGNCLLNMINAEQIAKYSCPSMKASVDVVAPHVINCSARDAIFNCIKPLMNLTESTNVSLIGSLLDRFTLADWTAASNAKVLCSRIKAIAGAFNDWQNFIDARTALGLTSPPICNNHAAVLSNLTQAALSADCKQVSTTKRKRRDTTSTALTCSIVNSMGSSVTSLNVSTLSTITATEFPNCAYNLGRISGFSADQLQALANIAKSAYNGDLSQWTAVQIRTAAGIVTGLPAQNIANLKLNNLEAIDAIGNYGSWLSDKVVSAFGSLLTNYKNNNVTALTAAELQSMGELVCGATATQIQSIIPDRFCGAIQDIGKTKTCEASQLQAWVSLAKTSKCLGSDVKQWSAGDVQSLGAVIGGLTQSDLGLLTSTQIASITERSLPFIPPAQFNGFSLTQLQSFSTTQLAVMTTAQYQSLDSSKQQYVVNALTSVGSELLNNPTVKGNGQKNAGHQLIGSISIPLLAAAAAAVLLIKM